jgi:hypothetical protein
MRGPAPIRAAAAKPYTGRLAGVHQDFTIFRSPCSGTEINQQQWLSRESKDGTAVVSGSLRARFRNYVVDHTALT